MSTKERNPSAIRDSKQIHAMKDETDYARLDAMSEEEIERNALEDTDAPPTDEAFWGKVEASLPDPQKVPVHIRLSPGVLAFFRKGGPGYQTRINQVLEAYVAHRKRQASPR